MPRSLFEYEWQMAAYIAYHATRNEAFFAAGPDEALEWRIRGDGSGVCFFPHP